jgi:hypothetical protein
MRFPPLPRLLQSPLAATLGVVLCLGGLALPLRELTGKTPPAPAGTGARTAAADKAALPGENTWLRIKWLAPLASLRLSTTEGTELAALPAGPAGEWEGELALPLAAGQAELELEVDFGTSAESAVFVFLEPDGRESRHAHAIGEGAFREILRFAW